MTRTLRMNRPTPSPRVRRLLALLAALVTTAALAGSPAAAQQSQHDPALPADHADHAGQAGHAGGAHQAADPHAAHRAMMAHSAHSSDTAGIATRIDGGLDIPDVPVVTQDGEARHFYSDLVEGRTVVMNFVFTTCTTICPPMGANFGRLQKELGERLGRDVSLISVSVDPATDTPERLKAWGAKFGARDGWTLVTGNPREVERLLKALEVFTADIADHAPIVLIGNDPAGEWTRAYGLAGPKTLAEILDRVDSVDSTGTAGGAR